MIVETTKRNFLIIPLLAVLCLIMGCAGSPSAAPEPDELDIAIRDASDYLNSNIPAGSKIVILNIQSASAPFSDYIIDELIANAVNDRIFTVVDRHQLDLIRSELNFQLSGEVDDNLALAVGRFFGAQSIVSGTVSQLGNRYRLTIRALEVQTARVQGQYNRNIPPSPTITALINSSNSYSSTAYGSGIRVPSTTVFNETMSDGRVTQQQPVSILVNGTYTLMPRPRGRLGGVWQDIYISRVEVDSEYMTFFFENTEIAGSGYGRSGSIDWDRERATLIDLDKPNVYRRNTGRTGQGGGYIVSCVFPRIDGQRLRLENRQGIVFAEILLGEPD
jgi:TolB-like protein